jgi:DNA-binding NarL/FixJ family response regulator
MQNKIYKIAIVDDNRQTLQSLAELLNYTKYFNIVFSALSGIDFHKKMDELPPIDYPEVVLMDLDMKNMNGIEAIALGKIKFPTVKYIVLTVFDDEDKLFDSIKAGANGYLLKDEKIDVISEHIVNLIVHGFTPMSPSIARKTFDMLSKLDKHEEVAKSALLEVLSEREIEVLYLLIEGQNYKTIAEHLFISPNTVKKHISHIYEKLHVSSKAQVINLLNKKT